MTNTPLPVDNSAGSYLSSAIGMGNTVLNVAVPFLFFNPVANDTTTALSWLPHSPVITSTWIPVSSTWTFIPRNSALDWQVNVLNEDIVHSYTMYDKMNHTPFDAIVGFRDSLHGQHYPSGINTFADNQQHLDLENEVYIYNDLIGDSTLFLDNLNINRTATFSVDGRIVAGNSENPFFNYENQPTIESFWGAVLASFSDTNDFFVDSSGGDVLFKSSDIWLNFGFEVDTGARFEAVNDTLSDRCFHDTAYYDYQSPIFLNPKKDVERVNSAPIFKFIPNPFQDNVKLQYDIGENNAILSIYNTLGNIIYQQNILVSNKEMELPLDLPKGLYVEVVKCNDKFYHFKLIKQ